MKEDPPPDEIAWLLLDHVPVAVALLDGDLRYIACNQLWRAVVGLEGRNLVGQAHFQLVPDHKGKWSAVFRRALAGETLSGELEWIVWPNGAEDWIDWRVTPWRDRAGETGGLLVFFQRRTEQVRSRQRAEVLSQELNLLIDSATQYAIYMLDRAGRIVIWNAGAERLCGWCEDEVLGQPSDILFDQSDRDQNLPARQLAEAREKGCLQWRGWRPHKQNGRFLADVMITRIDDRDGQFVGFGQVVRDVTEEDRRARELETNEVQLRSILDSVPDAMIVIDEQGLIRSFSKAAEKLFGYDEGEVLGRNVSMLMPSPDRERHDSYIAEYRDTGVKRVIGQNRRVVGQRKDGTQFPHELTVAEAVGGGRRLFTGFLRDLSAEEAAEAQLQELQDELLHISRVSAVGTLATALAHELNQPLSAITSYVQTSASLLRANEDEVLTLIREALDEAGEEALRAGAIVRRLREFVSRGELERTVESPAELAEQACSIATVGAQARGIYCQVTIPDEIPRVLVDRVQIQQVLFNLIRNALEAVGKDGQVSIVASAEGTMTRFSVTDNGPGVPPDRVSTLFEPFAGSKTQGMGLGLSICRTIIEAHGGRLWYEPSLEHGAAFHFTVPALREYEVMDD